MDKNETCRKLLAERADENEMAEAGKYAYCEWRQWDPSEKVVQVTASHQTATPSVCGCSCVFASLYALSMPISMCRSMYSSIFVSLTCVSSFDSLYLCVTVSLALTDTHSSILPTVVSVLFTVVSVLLTAVS